MATLNAFKADVAKINEGDWVQLGEEFGDLEIKTKGFTDQYQDARQSRLRRVALRYGNDINKVPSSEVRKVLCELLIQHCLQDVRNLYDEKSQPVSFDLFKELITEDAYVDLYSACLTAVNLVSSQRDLDVAEAKKNSAKPSK